MSNDRRRKTAGAAGLAGGAALFGTGAAIRPLERKYNARIDRGFETRRQRIESIHGVTESGGVYHNPVPKAHGEYRLIEPHRSIDRAARGRKQAMLESLAHESKKAKRIPLAGQMGRRTGLLVGGGALAWGGGRQLVDKRVSRRDVDAAAGGAALGAAAYQGAGFALAPYERRVKERIRNDPVLHDTELAHRRKHGVTGARKGDPRYVDYFRTMPKELPGARLKRAVSYTHGGKTAAIGTTVAAGLAGTGAVRGSRKRAVAKSDDTSILRTGIGAAGLGLTAWGVSRSPFVGRALRTGIKSARRHDNAFAVEALQRAEAARGVIRYGTGLGERQLRQIRAVDQAINRVPRAIRPEVATAAGMLLLSGSRGSGSSSDRNVRVRINLNGRPA